MPPQIKEPQEAGKHSHQTRSSLLNKHFLPCDQITTFWQMEKNWHLKKNGWNPNPFNFECQCVHSTTT